MLQREVEKEILPYCAREGIGVLAWSPIGKGILSGKYHNGKRPKDRVRSDEDLFKPANVRASAPLVRELRRIGQNLGKTPAQVALAWLRRHPHVVPIPGGKRPAQAAENAGAAGWSLSSQELQGLDRILRRMRLDTF
jgi:aryl-alcohol dehydrogenase-like predicted oxidoreductase